MAIDSRISLAVRAPNVAPAINIFENALMNAQTRDLRSSQEARRAELAPFQLQEAQTTASTNRDAQRLSNIHQTGQRLKPFLDNNDPQGAQQFLLDNIAAIQTRIAQGSGEDVTESMEILAKIQGGDIQGALGDINAVAGLVNQAAGRNNLALQSNAPITDPVTGQVSTPVFNRSTGQTELVPIEGAFKETPTQIAERDVATAQKLSDISIIETRKKEDIKKTAGRTSDLKTKFSADRRASKVSLRKLSEVSKLAERATQGIPGQAKLLAARFFPGIDASDEGALSSAYKSLALDELSKFSGPTTDFEFAVTEDIAGSLGGGASANRARTASLQRAAWFANKQATQFDKWIDDGHNPDRFSFNMNEPVTFGKGENSLTITLQDVQDSAVAAHVSIDEAMKRLSRSMGGK